MRRTLPITGWAAILLLRLALPACAWPAGAAPDSPVGRWKTIDDQTRQVKSIVQIREINGELDGRIVQLFNPPVPHPRCIKCAGAFKNRLVLGMRILWGMRRQGNQWTGGRILDPENGEIYRCTITPENGGKVLQVRGYIGFSIFGRTQQWVRAGD
jgi:uncharacterized protein (DUF2147 family)